MTSRIEAKIVHLAKPVLRGFDRVLNGAQDEGAGFRHCLAAVPDRQDPPVSFKPLVCDGFDRYRAYLFAAAACLDLAEHDMLKVLHRQKRLRHKIFPLKKSAEKHGETTFVPTSPTVPIAGVYA